MRKLKSIITVLAITIFAISSYANIQPGGRLELQWHTKSRNLAGWRHNLLSSGIKTNRGFPLVGKCGWYSKDDPTDPLPHEFNADGSRFDENAFTCAMRSRAFGRYYRVTNLQNNKSVIVKHVDFGPARKHKGKDISDRKIDLTMAAFAAIEDLDTGIITVKIEEVRNHDTKSRRG